MPLRTLTPRYVSSLLALSLSLAAAGTESLRADIPPDLHPTMKYTAGWFGNSMNGVHPVMKNGVQIDTYYEYVQKDGNGLAVGPDGTCYVGSGWDETGRGLGFYKNGHDVGHCVGLSAVGPSLAVDDKYVYTCQNMPTPPGSPLDFTVVRWNQGWDAGPAPVQNPPIFHGYVGGLVAAKHKVYVGDPASNMVLVFDRDTFQLLQKFPVHAPWRMTIDNDGKLWVINRKESDPNKGSSYSSEDPNSTAQVTQYNTWTGQPTGKNIENMTGATAVAVTPDNTLLVAGPNSQVLEFNISGSQPVQSGALGVKGGVYSDPAGVMGPDRLFGLWGVGCDKAGNIYTLGRLPNADAGLDLRSFTPDGTKMNWQLYNVAFTGVCGVDPASDGLDVYTTATHFHLDPTKPPGQQAEWKGYTLSTAYDDGRFTQGWNAPMLRRLDGRLYMYLHPGDYIGIFRQGPAETFIPSGILDPTPPPLPTGGHAHDRDWPPQQPMRPGPPTHPVDTTPGPPMETNWMWRDENGDGKMQPSEIKVMTNGGDLFSYISGSWVDNKGDIWLCGDHTKIAHLPLQGFDAHQNPVYDWTKQILPKAPPELGDISRIQYDSDHDVMYLSGNPPNFKEITSGASFGPLLIRYDHWSTNPTVKWQIKVAQPASDCFFPAFSVAGDRVFFMQRFMSRIWVYSSIDGTFVGTITPTQKTGMSGWCDQSYGIQAFERKDGSYCVFAEDDYRPKVRFYYVPPQPQPSPPLPLPSLTNP
jgi:hypothetical protein